MRYSFAKLHGAGNDYIFMDGFDGKPVIPDPSAASVIFSRRSFSVGADGLILILPYDGADAQMRIFNADGSEAQMCGNGIRCVGKYLYDFGICRKTVQNIMTNSGLRTLSLHIGEDGLVESATVDMGLPDFSPYAIPVLWETAPPFDIPLEIEEGTIYLNCVSMGNPHAVVFTEDVDALCLEEIGPQIENSELFPERVNTEFIEIIDRKTLKFRVWERGSGETLACGTGICAAVAVACEKGVCPKNEAISVYAVGGCIEVVYKNGGIFMKGPAELAFVGEAEFDDQPE